MSSKKHISYQKTFDIVCVNLFVSVLLKQKMCSQGRYMVFNWKLTEWCLIILTDDTFTDFYVVIQSLDILNKPQRNQDKIAKSLNLISYYLTVFKIIMFCVQIITTLVNHYLNNKIKVSNLCKNIYLPTTNGYVLLLKSMPFQIQYLLFISRTKITWAYWRTS